MRITPCNCPFTRDAQRSRLFGGLGVMIDVLVQKRAPKESEGLFVASTCGPEAYLGDGKILPEDHSELAVWRETQGGSCAEVIKTLVYERMALTSLDERKLRVQGGEVEVIGSYAHPYWQWPVFYMLACKELGRSRFVIRFAIAGPGADVDKHLQYMIRVYNSLQFERRGQ